MRLLVRRREALKNRARLRVHVGTHEIICRVALLDREELAPGESAPVQLLLEAPTVALPGDRFAVRTFSPLATVGGGVVLDARPDKHRRKNEAVLKSLQRLQGTPDEVVAEFFRLAASAAPTAGEVARRAARRGEQVAALAEGLAKAGSLVALPAGGEEAQYLHEEAFRALGALLGALQGFFRENPYRLCMAAADLQARLRWEAEAVVVGAVMMDLEREGRLKLDGNKVSIPKRRVKLPAGEGEMLQRIESAFREGGLTPPAEEEVRERLAVKADAWERLVGLLVDGERLVRVGDRVIYHRDYYRAAREAVERALAERGGVTVAELRDGLGVSRKYALALLEHFDSINLTRREGERHVRR